MLNWYYKLLDQYLNHIYVILTLVFILSFFSLYSLIADHYGFNNDNYAISIFIVLISGYLGFKFTVRKVIGFRFYNTFKKNIINNKALMYSLIIYVTSLLLIGFSQFVESKSELLTHYKEHELLVVLSFISLFLISLFKHFQFKDNFYKVGNVINAGNVSLLLYLHVYCFYLDSINENISNMFVYQYSYNNIYKFSPDSFLFLFSYLFSYFSLNVLFKLFLKDNGTKKSLVSIENKVNKNPNPKKAVKLSKEEIHSTAVHEAGHLMIFSALGSLSQNTKVTVSEYLDAKLGKVSYLIDTKKLKSNEFRRWYMDVCLAGAAAEKSFFGFFTKGSENDFDDWMKTAKQYLYATDSNFVRYPITSEDHEVMQDQMTKLKESQMENLVLFFNDNKTILTEMADYLSEHLTMDYKTTTSFLSRVDCSRLEKPFGDFNEFNQEAYLVRYNRAKEKLSRTINEKKFTQNERLDNKYVIIFAQQLLLKIINSESVKVTTNENETMNLAFIPNTENMMMPEELDVIRSIKVPNNLQNAEYIKIHTYLTILGLLVERKYCRKSFYYKALNNKLDELLEDYLVANNKVMTYCCNSNINSNFAYFKSASLLLDQFVKEVEIILEQIDQPIREYMQVN